MVSAPAGPTPSQLQQVSEPPGRSCGQSKQNLEESWLPPRVFKAGLPALGHLRPPWLQSQEQPFGKLCDLTPDKRNQMKNYAKLPESTCDWPHPEPHSADEGMGNRHSHASWAFLGCCQTAKVKTSFNSETHLQEAVPQIHPYVYVKE